ncbi:MAG: hypothetical protein U9O94_01960 [Nanoarchaeota archaeon]|nr:hypothetical protein [Nanoarchaeota archaeon]
MSKNIEDVITPQSNARLENEFNTSIKFKDSVSTVPTEIPTTYDNQIVIYKNGATLRLYVYVDDSWHYSSLT